MPRKEARPLEPMPPFGAAVQVARLELLRVSRGRAVRAGAVTMLLIVTAALLGSWLGEGDAGATFNGTVRSLFPFLAMALGLLFATRAMADDVETATVHFLLMLPSPRWTVVVGKYLCVAAVTTVLMVGGTVLLYVGTHLTEPDMFARNLGDLGRGLAGISAASLCYTALFLFLGAAVSDLPYLLSLLYVAMVEVGLGAVSFLEIASVRYHAGVVMGVPHEPGLLGTPDTPVWVSLLVMGVLSLVGLALTGLLAETSEYRTGRP